MYIALKSYVSSKFSVEYANQNEKEIKKTSDKAAAMWKESTENGLWQQMCKYFLKIIIEHLLRQGRIFNVLSSLFPNFHSYLMIWV